VGQVFPLEVDFGSAAMPGEVLGEVERRWPSNVGVEEVAQLGLKIRVVPDRYISRLQFLQGGHEGFGDEFPPEVAEVSLFVGKGGAIFYYHAGIPL
jgi:hypothetical protein